MTSKAGVEGVIDGLYYRIFQIHGCLHHFQRPAQVSETNVASLGIIEDKRSGTHIEFEDLPLLSLRKHSRRSIFVNNRPQVSLQLQLWDVELCQFDSKTSWQLLLACGGIWWVHAHEDSEFWMQLGLNDVCSLIQKNMVTFNDRGELVEDGVAGQVDLVKEDPITALQALDQSTFNELKNEASS